MFKKIKFLTLSFLVITSSLFSFSIIFLSNFVEAEINDDSYYIQIDKKTVFENNLCYGYTSLKNLITFETCRANKSDDLSFISFDYNGYIQNVKDDKNKITGVTKVMILMPKVTSSIPFYLLYAANTTSGFTTAYFEKSMASSPLFIATPKTKANYIRIYNNSTDIIKMKSISILFDCF